MPLPAAIQALLDRIEAIKDQVNTDIHPLLRGNVNANYQASYLHNRLGDVCIATRRLGENDNRSIALSAREINLMPQIRPRQQFSKKLQKIMQEQYVITGDMRHDYESLFIYGNLALDHWARVVGTLCGVRIKHFAGLYHTINKPGRPTNLDNVFNNHNDKITWLYYNLRAHRNGFIEHLDRPMQGGSTRPTHLMGFSLFSPSASGTVSTTREAALHMELLSIGASLMTGIPSNHWQRTRPRGTLQFLVQRIQQIPTYDDREKVGNIWQELGGETVSYEVLVDHLLNLLASVPSTLQ